MTYETLQVERFTDQMVVLARRGRRFRVITMPRLKVLPRHVPVRWTFDVAEVARRAFEFVVASERFWEAPWRDARRPALRRRMQYAGRAFRDAALAHREPLAASDVRALVAALRFRG